LDDTSTSVCEAIDRLKVEILSLSRELNKVLEDAVYILMKPNQMQAFDERRNELKRLVGELAQLHQFQQQQSIAIASRATFPEQSLLGALESPPDPA